MKPSMVIGDNDPIMETYKGERINVEYISPDQIKIADIAHSLSLICRYNGHCRTFYSVAEHSIILSRYVWEIEKNQKKALFALLHDAPEAYLGDVIRPNKWRFGGYAELEKTIQELINLKYQCAAVSGEDREHVFYLDTCILHDEKRELFRPDIKWVLPGEALGVKIHCLPPLDAEHDFINWFLYLTETAIERAADAA